MNQQEKDLHKKFATYGRNAREWTRKCVLLLPEIAEQQIWKKKGFGSIYEYAAKLAGMSRNTVDDALRILQKIADKPALKKLVAEKGLARVRPIATVATVENQEFWAEKASIMSKHTLETYVKDYRREFNVKSSQTILLLPDSENSDQRNLFSRDWQNPDQKSRPGTENGMVGKNTNTSNGEHGNESHPQNCQPPEPARSQEIPMSLDSKTGKQSMVLNRTSAQISMSLTAETALRLKKLKGTSDWNSFMQELLKTYQQKLDQELIQEKPAPVKTESRHIPARIKRFVIKKTSSLCAYPTCTKPHTSLHHTQRFSLERVHDPDRLVAVCTGHERIAHLGLIDQEESSAQTWQIRKQPDRNQPKFFVDQLVGLYRGG